MECGSPWSCQVMDSDEVVGARWIAHPLARGLQTITVRARVSPYHSVALFRSHPSFASWKQPDTRVPVSYPWSWDGAAVWVAPNRIAVEAQPIDLLPTYLEMTAPLFGSAEAPTWPAPACLLA